MTAGPAAVLAGTLAGVAVLARAVPRRPLPPAGSPGSGGSGPGGFGPRATAWLATPRRLGELAAGRLSSGRSAEARLDEVAVLADALVSELAAGASPSDALVRAAADVADPAVRASLTAAAGSAAWGGRPSDAMRRLSATEGLSGLQWVAAAWEVSESTGVALVAPLATVAASVRDELQHRHDLAARLAGARATVRLLAGLPLVGLVLGQSLGADPVGVLLGSPPGWACLLAGVALEAAGLAWTGRVVASARALA